MKLRELYRMSKAELVELVLEDASRRGRQWAAGGPQQWSKDELISYLFTETGLVKR